MIKHSLFADQEREAKLNELGDTLRLLEQHVDFAALAAAVDAAAPRPSRERGGRPPFPTELMVRVLLIQQLFNLSDEQMEFQLLDRLSFQRFAGLRHSSQIPDRTTIWTFKERLIQAGASEHDNLHFEAVIDPGNTSRDIYADKGYVDGEREDCLKGQGAVRGAGTAQQAHRQTACPC